MTDQSFPATKLLRELAQQLLDAAHYSTKLSQLEGHCRDIAHKIESLAEGDGDEAARTSTTTPVCCYCDAPLSCASCGREQPDDAAQPKREAVIEECARVAESYPSSGEQTEHPVEYWIRRLSISRPQRDTL